MACHSVLRNINRQRIPLLQEFHTPVQALRCHRPAGIRMRIARRAVYILRCTVLSRADLIAVIDILPDEVNRLMNQCHFLLCKPGQVPGKLLKPFLRIVPEHNGVRKPADIPRPVLHRLIKTKIYFFRCCNIFCAVRCRIGNAAGRTVADSDRPARIFTKHLHRTAMSHHQMMCCQKGFSVIHFQSRCVNPVQVAKAYRTLWLIECDKIFTQV